MHLQSPALLGEEFPWDHLVVVVVVVAVAEAEVVVDQEEA